MECHIYASCGGVTPRTKLFCTLHQTTGIQHTTTSQSCKKRSRSPMVPKLSKTTRFILTPRLHRSHSSSGAPAWNAMISFNHTKQLKFDYCEQDNACGFYGTGDLDQHGSRASRTDPVTDHLTIPSPHAATVAPEVRKDIIRHIGSTVLKCRAPMISAR